jgi:hypothetical protein
MNSDIDPTQAALQAQKDAMARQEQVSNLISQTMNMALQFMKPGYLGMSVFAHPLHPAANMLFCRNPQEYVPLARAVLGFCTEEQASLFVQDLVKKHPTAAVAVNPTAAGVIQEMATLLSRIGVLTDTIREALPFISGPGAQTAREKLTAVLRGGMDPEPEDHLALMLKPAVPVEPVAKPTHTITCSNCGGQHFSRSGGGKLQCHECGVQIDGGVQ